MINSRSLGNSSITSEKQNLFYSILALMCGMLGMQLLQYTAKLPENVSSTSNVTHNISQLRGEKEDDMQWMNTTGITLLETEGDPTTCKDVIYMADNRSPTENTSHVYPSWKALSYIVQNFPSFNSTCAAYYHIQKEKTIHPVWGRLPVTALAMSHFTNAGIFLYLDTDALLANARYTPQVMYEIIVNEYKGEMNATSKELLPSLIVNKPRKGWLCKAQCVLFNLGHGCFNSGVLLWRRSEGVNIILKAWWGSRLDNATQNIYDEVTNQWFYGWNGPRDKMSEQNRLMYIYHTNPEVRKRILPVPRQQAAFTNYTSCPEKVDKDHTPCLQDDYEMNAKWNRTGPSCFVNHYSNRKKFVHMVYEKVLNWNRTSSYPI